MDVIQLKEERSKIVKEMEKAKSTLDEKAWDDMMDQIRKFDDQIKREETLSTLQTEAPKIDPSVQTEERDYEKSIENYRHYLKTGEFRDLTVGTGGGAIAPTKLAGDILGLAVEENPLTAKIHTEMLTSAQSIGVPYLATDLSDFDWTIEVPSSAITPDSAMAFDSRSLTPMPLVKEVDIARQLLTATPQNVEDLVKTRMGIKFGKTIENVVCNGTGSNQGLGLFTASADGVPTSRDVRAASNTTLTFDDLVDAISATKTYYRKHVLVGPDTEKTLWKMKDNNGQYIWQPSVVSGQPSKAWGLEVIVSEFAPDTYAADNYVAIIGDLSYVWLVMKNQLTIERVFDSTLGRKNLIGFIGYAEADLKPALGEAFTRIQLAAT